MIDHRGNKGRNQSKRGEEYRNYIKRKCNLEEHSIHTNQWAMPFVAPLPFTVTPFECARGSVGFTSSTLPLAALTTPWTVAVAVSRSGCTCSSTAVRSITSLSDIGASVPAASFTFRITVPIRSDSPCSDA